MPNHNIHRNNYELFMLDFIEGNLSTEQHEQVVLFLEQNPDLASLIENFGEVKLSAPNQKFKAKHTLYRSESAETFDSIDLLFARQLEGDLSPEEALQLETQIFQNQQLQSTAQLMSQCKLSANLALTMEHKEVLYQFAWDNQFIGMAELDSLIISHFEGLLSSESSALLIASCHQDPVAQRQWDLLSSAYLTAPIISMPSKEGLKRSIPLAKPRYRQSWFHLQAAAVVLLILFSLLPRFSPQQAPLAYSFKKALENTLQNPSLQSTVDAKRDISIQPIHDDAPKQQNATQPTSLQTVASIHHSGFEQSAAIQMTTTGNAPTAFVLNDSIEGYYQITAESTQSRLKKLPLAKEVTRLGARYWNKGNRIIQDEREKIMVEKPQNYLYSMAEIALTGFNKLTESDFSLPKDRLKEDKASEN